MIIGIIDIAPADKHSFNVIENKSFFAMAMVNTAVTNTFTHDPAIVLKNRIIIF